MLYAFHAHEQMTRTQFIIIGPAPFSGNIWQGCNTIREVLLDELPVFLVLKLLLVFRTGPFSNIVTPLAAN